MQVNDLWNLLSCHGPNETVVIDATGLKIGRHGHIDVPCEFRTFAVVYDAKGTAWLPETPIDAASAIEAGESQ